MICYNCKNKIIDNSKYCPRCGIIFDSEDVKKNSNDLDNSLIDIYLPKKEAKINFYDMSVYYFIFGFSYAFYKKMYYIGIVSFFANLYLFKVIFEGMNIVFQSYGFFSLFIIFSLLLCLFIHLYYTFNFNKLFLINIKHRVSKITREHPNMKYDSLTIICQKDSKNNLPFAIISAVLFFLLVIISFL